MYNFQGDLTDVSAITKALHSSQRTCEADSVYALPEYRTIVKYSRTWFISKAGRCIFTVGPLIIESLWAKKRVSTGALGALDNPLVVQTKI